jgi:hypothetical protein
MPEVMVGLESFEQTPIVQAMNMEYSMEELEVLHGEINEELLKVQVLSEAGGQLNTLYDDAMKKDETDVSSLSTTIVATEAILRSFGIDKGVAVESIDSKNIKVVALEFIVDGVKKIFTGIINIIKKLLTMILKVFAFITGIISVGFAGLTAALAYLIHKLNKVDGGEDTKNADAGSAGTSSSSSSTSQSEREAAAQKKVDDIFAEAKADFQAHGGFGAKNAKQAEEAVKGFSDIVKNFKESHGAGKTKLKIDVEAIGQQNLRVLFGSYGKEIIDPSTFEHCKEASLAWLQAVHFDQACRAIEESFNHILSEIRSGNEINIQKEALSIGNKVLKNLGMEYVSDSDAIIEYRTKGAGITMGSFLIVHSNRDKLGFFSDYSDGDPEILIKEIDITPNAIIYYGKDVDSLSAEFKNKLKEKGKIKDVFDKIIAELDKMDNEAAANDNVRKIKGIVDLLKIVNQCVVLYSKHLKANLTMAERMARAATAEF